MANPNRGVPGAGGYFANPHRASSIQVPTDFGNDGNGVDVQFYSETDSAKFTWDASARTAWVGDDAKWVDVKLFGSTSGAYALWDGSADTLFVAKGKLVTTTKTQVTLRSSASLIEFTPTTNKFDFNNVAIVCDNTGVTPGPWGASFMRQGSNLYLKLNATSLSTAVYRYIKLNATSVAA